MRSLIVLALASGCAQTPPGTFEPGIPAAEPVGANGSALKGTRWPGVPWFIDATSRPSPLLIAADHRLVAIADGGAAPTILLWSPKRLSSDEARFVTGCITPGDAGVGVGGGIAALREGGVDIGPDRLVVLSSEKAVVCEPSFSDGMRLDDVSAAGNEVRLVFSRVGETRVVTTTVERVAGVAERYASFVAGEGGSVFEGDRSISMPPFPAGNGAVERSRRASFVEGGVAVVREISIVQEDRTRLEIGWGSTGESWSAVDELEVDVEAGIADTLAIDAAWFGDWDTAAPRAVVIGSQRSRRRFGSAFLMTRGAEGGAQDVELHAHPGVDRESPKNLNSLAPRRLGSQVLLRRGGTGSIEDLEVLVLQSGELGQSGLIAFSGAGELLGQHLERGDFDVLVDVRASSGAVHLIRSLYRRDASGRLGTVFETLRLRPGPEIESTTPIGRLNSSD